MPPRCILTRAKDTDPIRSDSNRSDVIVVATAANYLYISHKIYEILRMSQELFVYGIKFMARIVHFLSRKGNEQSTCNIYVCVCCTLTTTASHHPAEHC